MIGEHFVDDLASTWRFERVAGVSDPCNQYLAHEEQAKVVGQASRISRHRAATPVLSNSNACNQEAARR